MQRPSIPDAETINTGCRDYQDWTQRPSTPDAGKIQPTSNRIIVRIEIETSLRPLTSIHQPTTHHMHTINRPETRSIDPNTGRLTHPIDPTQPLTNHPTKSTNRPEIVAREPKTGRLTHPIDSTQLIPNHPMKSGNREEIGAREPKERCVSYSHPPPSSTQPPHKSTP